MPTFGSFLLPRLTRARVASSLVASITLAASLLARAAALDALPWPEFRGPGGQGHALSARLPIHWDSTRNVRWRVVVPGSGWSSPVIGGDRLFLTAALPAGGGDGTLRLAALCFDLATGKSLWTNELFHPKPAAMHGKNSHASPTPTLAPDRVYVHFGPYGTACLDFAGRVLWKTDALAYPPVHGGGSSPVLAGDRLILNCDGGSEPFVAALDIRDGRVAWRVARHTSAGKTFSFCTPSLIDTGRRTELITPGSGVVHALDPATGREFWRARYGEGYSVVPRPVFANGLVFLGTGYDRPSVLAFRTGGSGDVTETHLAWSLTRGAPNTPSMLLLDGRLYMVSDGGIASCLDAATGEIHWQERLGGNYSASPLHAAGRIYFQSEEGTAHVLKAGLTFAPIATNKLGERTLASYAVAHEALFIRTAAHLYRIQE